MIQDVIAGHYCFLSQPQWRRLLVNPAVSPMSHESPSISLRARLCDFLADIPDLQKEISDVSNLGMSRSLDPKALYSRQERILVRVIAMKFSVETWYVTELEPRLLACDPPSRALLQSGSPSWSTCTEGVNEFEYSEILLAVLDCVTNTLLIKLDKLLAGLTSTSPQQHPELEFETCTVTIARRQATVCSSFNFIKKNSKVAAKPLEVGLQQLESVESMVAPE